MLHLQNHLLNRTQLEQSFSMLFCLGHGYSGYVLKNPDLLWHSTLGLLIAAEIL
jgi:hypothetical protein